ncbi:MAG: hypothetical protein WKG01_35905 [Kofleriaceae bacterium]
MKHRSIVLTAVLLIVAAGCGKKATPPAAPDCAGAVDNILQVSHDDITKNSIDSVKLKNVLLARCKEDSWSADVTKCVIAAKMTQGLTNCQEKVMTADQKDKLAQAIQDVAAASDPGSGSANPGSGSGSADPGSAGSADSGSGSAGSGATK